MSEIKTGSELDSRSRADTPGPGTRGGRLLGLSDCSPDPPTLGEQLEWNLLEADVVMVWGFGATWLFLLNLKFCICKMSSYKVLKSKLVQFCLLSLQLLS